MACALACTVLAHTTGSMMSTSGAVVVVVVAVTCGDVGVVWIGHTEPEKDQAEVELQECGPA